LIADPPPTYAVVSAALDIPVGSIGPTRARCLGKLRRMSGISQLVDDASAPEAPSGKDVPSGKDAPSGKDVPSGRPATHPGGRRD
jgi:hypothetical protein